MKSTTDIKLTRVIKDQREQAQQLQKLLTQMKPKGKPDSGTLKRMQAIAKRRLTINFNPNHDMRGRFAIGEVGSTVSRHGRAAWPKGTKSLVSLYQRIGQPDGGFSYNPFTWNQPKQGFALSIHPDRSVVKEASELKLNDITHYLSKNKDLLRVPGNYLGAWHDPATHKVWLDVSTVVSSPEKARSLGKAANQLAYFDLSKGSSVTINRLLPQLYLLKQPTLQEIQKLYKLITGKDATKTELRRAVKDLTLNYNPNHDELGQFATAYHGTSSKNWASIKEKGLIPKFAPGGDVMADKMGMPIMAVGDRAASVYITRDQQEAMMFAMVSTKVRGGTPEVLKLKIPVSEIQSHVKPDEFINSSDAYRFVGPIKPEWIVDHKYVPPAYRKKLSGMLEISGMGGGATVNEEYVTLYMVVHFHDDMANPTANFNPNHDELGKFASGGYVESKDKEEYEKTEIDSTEGNPDAIGKGLPLTMQGAFDYQTANKADLTSEEKAAIENYTGYGYSNTNEYLRYGKFSTPEQKAILENQARLIDSAIEKSKPLPDELIVHRNVSGKFVVHPGDMIEDKAFASTSMFTGSAERFGRGARMSIKLPKGSKVLMAYPHTVDTEENKSEAEVILPRSAKLKVLWIAHHPRDLDSIDAELVL